MAIEPNAIRTLAGGADYFDRALRLSLRACAELSSSIRMSRQLFWFGVVGVSAMLVHLGSVALFLVPLGLPPLIANLFGFLLAFQVSHIGHHRFTFGDAHAPIARSRQRFFLVALTSFFVNELMYAALLRFTELDYRLALAIVLIAVAALTFVSARRWAFAPDEV